MDDFRISFQFYVRGFRGGSVGVPPPYGGNYVLVAAVAVAAVAVAVVEKLK